MGDSQGTGAPPHAECLLCHDHLPPGEFTGSMTFGSVSFHLCKRHAELAVGLYRTAEAGWDLVQLLKARAALAGLRRDPPKGSE
ncbi:MAG: hypothetical protein ABIK89_05005 [Planctomycetota bacterium]